MSKPNNRDREKSLANERQRREKAEVHSKFCSKIANERLEETVTLNTQLLSALAAIEKHNKGGYCKLIGTDLSALREHDAEVRKPMVDALKCVQLMFERNDASDNFLGDDEQEAWTAVNDALAKVKAPLQ